MTIGALYIDPSVENDPVTVFIRSRIAAPVFRVEDEHEVYAAVSEAADPVSAGKQVLYLTRNKGAFIKKCPGTRHYLCCGYMILHIGTFCTMDCAYCILQSYFHPPVLQFFVNREDMMAELRRAFEAKEFRRIGTGEFTDSLIWEPWTDLSRTLIPAFAGQDYMALELKTKTVHVDALADLRHNRKTILAWSVNTEAVIRENERGTASLDARLRAAARCVSWGYPVAFHFDPMVLYEGCETGYREVVERIFAAVPPEAVVWISLGTFRFMPSLKPVVQKRFPKSSIVYGEFIPGLDDKMRYFKPLRIALCRNMASWIRAAGPDVTVYLCMEDEDVWRKAFGFAPDSVRTLPGMLDDSAIRHCNLQPDPLGAPSDDQ